MDIRPLPTDQLHLILPLLTHVQNLHVAEQPHMYHPFTDDAATLDWLNDWVCNQHTHILVAGPEHAPTGYIAYATFEQPADLFKPKQTYLSLEHICVDPKHRRAGLATQLIAAMRDRVQRSGKPSDTIRVGYAAWNKASAALMAREGFVISSIEAEAPLNWPPD